MYAICVECSHKRGMGHLYRSMAFTEYLTLHAKRFIVLINDDPVSCSILSNQNIPYRIVNTGDLGTGWESEIIGSLNIRLWINDRLDTCYEHALNVKKNNIGLITFDDRGSGAEYSDINIAPLVFYATNRLKGKKVLSGKDFLILNKEIDRKRRLRQDMNKLIVTLGGSDTYGVTKDIVRILQELGLSADVHVGPSFHRDALQGLLSNSSKIIDRPPSLIETFFHYDLAITGGGITPFEANGTGLPCLTVSSEEHEREICTYLNDLGTSRYIGHRGTVTPRSFQDALSSLNIRKMSETGMREINTSGIENIMEHLRVYG